MVETSKSYWKFQMEKRSTAHAAAEIVTMSLENSHLDKVETVLWNIEKSQLWGNEFFNGT